MPTTRVRKVAKTKQASKADESSGRASKAGVTKSDRWYFVPTESGGYRRIFRPKGKTSVPRAVIRKAVKKVVAQRLEHEAHEG